MKLDCLAVELDGADFLLASQQLLALSARQVTYKVYADGGNVALGVGVVGETEEQARLSDARVANKEQLEQVIVPVDAILSRRRI